jgi:predicted nucleic acid-binding protein
VLSLDTGCLVKLTYPEAKSASVAEAVAGETIGFTALHALELTTALQAKVFRSEATREQADAAHAAVEEDLASGKLVRLDCDWAAAWKEAQTLAFQHAATTGCRALDTLHCAVARALAAREMLTTDARQTTLATAAGIALRRW